MALSSYNDAPTVAELSMQSKFLSEIRVYIYWTWLVYGNNNGIINRAYLNSIVLCLLPMAPLRVRLEDLLAQLVNIKLGLLKGLPPVFGNLNNLPVKHLLCGLLFIFIFIFIL